MSDRLKLHRTYFSHRIKKIEREYHRERILTRSYSYTRLWVSPSFFKRLLSLEIISVKGHGTIGIVNDQRYGLFLSELLYCLGCCSQSDYIPADRLNSDPFTPASTSLRPCGTVCCRVSSVVPMSGRSSFASTPMRFVCESRRVRST